MNCSKPSKWPDVVNRYVTVRRSLQDSALGSGCVHSRPHVQRPAAAGQNRTGRRLQVRNAYCCGVSHGSGSTETLMEVDAGSYC